MVSSPKAYFWLMAQILIIYVGMGLVVCHFFRKFCQDPDEEEVSRVEDADPQDNEVTAS